MGRVYRGEDTILGDVTVAVKFLAQTLLNDKMRERFEREATICALLSEKSIHIVRVRDYGIDQDGIPYYVMEFLQGDNLNDIIAKSVLALPRFFKMVRQICLGMDAAHEGIKFKGEQSSIIHRDIKPSNILVLEDASLGELVKVLDFGIAKLNQASASQTHSFMGTLAYCSPEQMEGKELDYRSDIYSFGIMMYEMLTGDMPVMPETNSFGGWYRAHHETPPIPFDPNLKLPQPLIDIIMRCMAKDREDRPQSVAEIWQTMEPIAKQFNRNLPKVVGNPDAAIALPGASISPEEFRLDISEETRVITSATSIQSKAMAGQSFSGQTIPKRDKPSKEDDNSIRALCAEQSWPTDKPQSRIVFPSIITSDNLSIPSLWGMLESSELAKRRSNSRYNQFLFIEVPHPMLLWITVLFNNRVGARWLPCYLDLKTTTGQHIARLIAEKGTYQILLFAIGQPEKYEYLTQATIADKQRQQLLRWANKSQSARGSDPNVSKQQLKQGYENLKGKILMKLESAETNVNVADQ